MSGHLSTSLSNYNATYLAGEIRSTGTSYSWKGKQIISNVNVKLNQVQNVILKKLHLA